MKEETIENITKLLIEKKMNLAFAESATAGALCARFSLMDDAGAFLKGGIACYDACLKQSLLDVDEALLKKYTPESMEVTKAITMGLDKLIPADIHIGVTGLTCPGGSETAEKPVGTMFIYAVHHQEHIFSERMNFTGSQEEIVLGTIARCAELLEDYLLNLN